MGLDGMGRMPSPELMKKPCVKCGETDRDKRGDCRRCKREGYRKWSKANRERIAEYARKRHEANPEKEVARQRKWVRAHPEKIAAYRDNYRKAHPEKIAAYRRKYRKAHPEKIAAYRKANPEKIAAYQANYRARKAGNGGSHTGAELVALFAHYGNRCLKCGRTDLPLHADHVISLHYGGSSDISNIQSLCGPCNSTKGTKHIDYRTGERLQQWKQQPLFSGDNTA